MIVTFFSKVEAIKCTTMPLKTAEQALLLTYLSKCTDRVSISRIPSEIKEEWPVIAVLERMKEVTRAVQVTWIKQINWWGYGLEINIQVPENDLNNFAETIQLPDETKVAVIIKGDLLPAILTGRRDT